MTQRSTPALFVPVVIAMLAMLAARSSFGAATTACDAEPHAISLSQPTEHKLSLEAAMQQRRSTRNFSSLPLSLADLSQILWAAQGVTDSSSGKRTAPSSGRLYPLELYLAANNVDSLPHGLYKYQSVCHRLVLVKAGDFRRAIFNSALQQPWVLDASAVIIYSADPAKIAGKYQEHPRDSVLIEAGHISQNVYLQCASLDIGVVAIGGFSRTAMHVLLGLNESEEVVYLNLIGHRQH